MRKIYAFISLFFVLISSCAYKAIPLKGKYPDPPIVIKSSKNFEEVWGNLVDLFMQKGLSIKIIDKSSGIIVSDKTEFSTTIEDENGNLIDKNAFIVVPKIYSQRAGKFTPLHKQYYSTIPMLGEWNVRVKKLDDGCEVNVNIVNLSYTYVANNIMNQKTLTEFRSTGIFESLIFEKIN